MWESNTMARLLEELGKRYVFAVFEAIDMCQDTICVGLKWRIALVRAKVASIQC
jgi:hypothetical protein